MFRKPKRKLKQSLRRKEDDDDDEKAPSGFGNQSADDEETTTDLISEARKRVKSGSGGTASSASASKDSAKQVMHSYASAQDGSSTTNKDLATSQAMHLPTSLVRGAADDKYAGKAERGADGIFRDTTRNKFHAGPIKAAGNVRVTARFDYQPDICKDYKDTGFCGYGDTCIYLHDRGDTLSGWQLEQRWEEEQRQKKQRAEQEMDAFLEGEKGGGEKKEGAATITTDDGLPFACHLCREHFKDPVVTTCGHYFCQDCILDHIRGNSTNDDSCPICHKDTHGVFNQPTKLIAKKRRALGARKAQEEDSWQEFFKVNSGQAKDD